MTLTLLLDDTPSSAPLALAHEYGWLSLPFALETVAPLTADTAREHPDALLVAPVGEYATLQREYSILPGLAAGGNYNAAIVLVADEPLPGINECLVDLADASRTAEALARATLRKYYGLRPLEWLRGPGPEGLALPTVEVREGGEALHLLDDPGDRDVVDLGRAWFVLTGLPPVTHLLLAPDRLLQSDPEGLRAAQEALAVARTLLADRQDDLRRELATRYGVSRATLDRYYDDQFTTLTGDAQKSIRALFANAPGLDLPPVGPLKLPPGILRS